MKVAYISRSTLFTDPGGDTTQITKTAEAVKGQGVHVDIYTSEQAFDPKKYDLLHLFNLTRPADLLPYCGKQTPFVLSTIYLEYREADKYMRKDLVSRISSVFGYHTTEYLKVLARWLKNGERPQSFEYLWLGQLKSMRKVVKCARVLLPNSESEMNRMVNDLGVSAPHKAVANAVDASFFELPEKYAWKERVGVLSVGRIEPRKNQLNLIKACKLAGLPLTLIGKVGNNHQAYFEACKAEFDDSIRFVDRIPLEELIDYFQKSKVHALPSWFETTGLSSLEAAALGCNLVISNKGDTLEYFKNDVWYGDPIDIESISAALIKAHQAPQQSTLKDRLRRENVWEVTAKQTIEAYHRALNLQLK